MMLRRMGLLVVLPGVYLQLASRDVSAGELVHAVMSPIVCGEHPQQERTCLLDIKEQTPWKYYDEKINTSSRV